jgi:2-polyprenyl-3-methyl-5-hydroxy-6-metoxy-1,4-benzoquinol methylase
MVVEEQHTVVHPTLSPPADLQVVKERQQLAWSAGDYARIGASILLTAELLCEAVDLRSGQQVLDVAGGTGNAALAAARRFCRVTATDYVPALLEQACVRAAAEGLPMAIQECSLPTRSRLRANWCGSAVRAGRSG